MQLSHVAPQEVAVGVDRVAAQRALPRQRPVLQERHGLGLGLARVDGARAHAVQEPVGREVLAAPVAERSQLPLVVVHDQHRPLRQHLQIRRGDDGGDLEDVALVRVEPGHLQVDPDEVVGALRHRASRGWRLAHPGGRAALRHGLRRQGPRLPAGARGYQRATTSPPPGSRGAGRAATFGSAFERRGEHGGIQIPL